MGGLAALSELFRFEPKKHRYLEFDVKPPRWRKNAIRIKTDVSNELEISFGDAAVSISKSDAVDELSTLASATKGEDTKFIAGFGWYHSKEENCLKPETKIPDDAFCIWDEIIAELKNTYKLDLEPIEKGRYRNRRLKLLGEINSLVDFAETACKEYGTDHSESIKDFDDFSDDGVLIFRNLPRFNLHNIILEEIYSDKNLYSSSDMFSPPAERKKNALRLELTSGCDWNKCTFCSGYSEIPYHEKTYKEFEEHLKDVLFNLDGYYSRYINKVFIGGGNALSADMETLFGAIGLINRRLPHLKQVSAYGRAGAILKRGEDNLNLLNMRGLNMVYMGIESGSDRLLKYVNKGCTSKQMVDAGKMVKNAGIKLSVMVMPGLGGKRFEEEHEAETARVINEIQPDYLTFMGVNSSPDTLYAKRMARDITRNHNRPLTDSEMIFQIYNMLADVEEYNGKMGCFGCDVDAVGHNPATFDNTRFDKEGKQKIRASLVKAAGRADGCSYLDFSNIPNHKY